MLAEDHDVVRSGLKMLLEDEPWIEIIAEAADGLEAIHKCEALQPDIIVMDINMPNLSGIEATKKILAKSRLTKILIFSMHNNEDYILDSIANGAQGYLLKNSKKAEIIQAIKTVDAGFKYFPPEISEVVVNSWLEKNKQQASPYAEKSDLSMLSAKEREILIFIKEGLSNKEIAQKIDISQRTVENHRANLMRKLGVNNLYELLKKVQG